MSDGEFGEGPDSCEMDDTRAQTTAEDELHEHDEEVDTDMADIIELEQDELRSDGQFDVEGSPSPSKSQDNDDDVSEKKESDKSDRKSHEKSKDRNRDRERNRDRDNRRDRRDSGRRDSGGRRDQRGGRFHPYGGRGRDAGRDHTMGRAVFVSNIPFEMKWQELKDLMRKEVGEVTYTELFYDTDGRSKGVGVVEFATRDNVDRCMTKMNKFQIRGRGIVVKVDQDGHYSDKYRRQAEKEQKARVLLTPQVLSQLKLDPSTVSNTIFVSNIPYDVEWRELKDIFRLAGEVTHTDVLMDTRGKSKGSATVTFESILDAVNAISMFDNQKLYSRKLNVRMDQVKPDRDRPPRQQLPSGLSQLGPSLESLSSGGFGGGGLGGGSMGGLGGGMGGGLGGGLGGGGAMGNMGLGNMGNLGNMGGIGSGLGNLSSNLGGGLGGGLDSNRMGNLGGSSGLGGGYGNNLGSDLSGNLGGNLGFGSRLGSSLGGMGGYGGGDLSQSSLSMAGLGSLGLGSDLSLLGNMGGSGGGGGGGGGGHGLLGSGGMGMGQGKDSYGDGMGSMGRDDRDRDRGRDRRDRDRRGSGVGGGRDRDRDNFRGGRGEQGCQVFVRNLPFKYTWQDLKDRFKSIGPVQFAEVKTHPETGRSKGFGTVRFQNPDDAIKAIREMSGCRVDGRDIEVSLDFA